MSVTTLFSLAVPQYNQTRRQERRHIDSHRKFVNLQTIALSKIRQCLFFTLALISVKMTVDENHAAGRKYVFDLNMIGKQSF